MATIFASRVAVSARPLTRTSSSKEEKVRASQSPSRVARVGAPVVILERHRNDEKNGRRRASLTVSIPTRASRKPQPAAASLPKRALSGLVAASLSATLALGGPAHAEIRLPPIDQDPDRCERAFVGNTIGQANAVSDRILDLRKCAYDGKDLSTKTLSGALMVDASFKGANLTEVVMSKAYALGADFTGADFTNAVVDRVTFDGADLTNANFRNAVITGATYDNTTLTGATFEEALIGKEDVKRLCENPTLVGNTRFEVGCKN